MCVCVRRTQICYAYAADGGRTVVVLSSKDKVVMEKLFRKAIPDRKGSRFIFRKGNSLLPNDLKEVSAPPARARCGQRKQHLTGTCEA